MTELFVVLAVIYLAFVMWYMGEYFHKARINIRLKSIEFATGIRLMDWQREIVLNEHQTYVYGRRRCGKTLTAIFWVLMWRKEPIKRSEEQKKLGKWKEYLTDKIPAIQDPDAKDYQRLMWTLKEYEKYAQMCKKAWIKVAHVVK